MVQLSFTLLIVPAVIIAVSSLFYDREIMALLYHSHVDDSADILGLLMAGFPGIAATYIFGTLLTANGSMKQLNLMAFGGMVLNVTLNLLLIPRFYAMGSAFSSMVTQLSTGMVQFLIVLSLFRLIPKKIYLLKLLLFVGVTIAAGFLSRFFDNRLVGYLFVLTVPVVFALAVRLVDPTGILHMIRNDA